MPFEFKRQSFGGRRAPEFEPYSKTKAINPEKGEVGTEFGEIVTANEKAETKNKKKGKTQRKKQKVDTKHSKIFKPHQIYRLHPNPRIDNI